MLLINENLAEFLPPLECFILRVINLRFQGDTVHLILKNYEKNYIIEFKC